MIVCGHACGGTDSARHAPNDLPRRLSGLWAEPCLAGPRAASRARPHAVPYRSPRGPYPSLPGRPRLPCLVQLMPSSLLSPVVF